ncbi:hypothetical protein IW261DRAFT_1603335 [Armillaria novae-zelandiae]|uniref:FAS1 domain-containing protein n=1 Tax=Armillaria novae-zelandiae TaxID=153914 RepID=A0AA39PMU2_9AGAR|nr:hypothetical protein IW261DRAFT_1603335 [Armillaria novae-zelandiae]
MRSLVIICRSYRFCFLEAAVPDLCSPCVICPPEQRAESRRSGSPWHKSRLSHRVGLHKRPEMYDLSTAIHAHGELAAMESSHDDSEKKRRRKFLRMPIRVILSYHVIPGEVGMQKLSDVSTYPTNLALRFAMHNEPQRIRVESSLIPPSTSVNFYSKVVSANTQTMNGLIHVVNRPLIPPITAFRELYSMAPTMFSIFTSAWQRSGLTDALDLRWVHGKGDKKGHIEGTSVTTAFVPTNHAFELLPKQLQYYLFSPFGAHTLKKLLQFHVIPDLSLHTDYIYNATSRHECSIPRVHRADGESHDDPLAQFLGEIVDTEEYAVSDGFSELISSVNFTAPALLRKHPLTVNILKFNVALNGAMHGMSTLLDPTGRWGMIIAKEMIGRIGCPNGPWKFEWFV